MFKRLRVRFIALTMASLLLVLGVILGAANLLSYRHVVRDADEVLRILSANGGSFPHPDGIAFQPLEPPRPETQARADDDDDWDDDDWDDWDDDDWEDRVDVRTRADIRSKELPYESRYFTVTLNAAGDVLNVDTGKIAAVDMDRAVAYAKAVLAKGRTAGFADDYRYLISDTASGRMIVFLDCGRNLATVRSFRLASIGVSAGGLLAVFLLILAFSGRIVRPVAESYEKQKRFITDAGHEIKTPLAIIEADADVLEMELESESEWLQDIRAQTRRLTALTNDLVYLSRMEERQGGAAQLVEFPLSDVVEETAQSFRSRALQKQVEFTERIEPMLSLKGDEKAIRQLVSILLDNAVKYAPEHGVITLSLEKQGRGAALSVYNTAAVPVPRESMDKLFDRFYRTDPSRSSATGGHGIGLSIARAVVNAHRGKITAETADERSLKITAWLPLGG